MPLNTIRPVGKESSGKMDEIPGLVMETQNLAVPLLPQLRK
jgi:hypothetical protein